MKKLEQAFGSKCIKWYGYNKHLLPKSFLLEFKIARDGKRFPLKEISEKELRLLRQAKNSSVIQTHSDFGGLGTNCDASVISGGGYIFLQFVRPRNKIFYIIDIDKIIELIDNKVKSLTEEHCIEIHDVLGELK
jgi:penicillin-binding protein-related factor A (putative recombinase)